MERVNGHEFRQMSVRRLQATCLQLLPVLTAVLLIAIRRQQTMGTADWGSFVQQVAMVLFAANPLLIGHLFAQLSTRTRALVGWIAIFGAYPIIASHLGWSILLTPPEWMVFTALSGMSLLFGSHGRANMLAWLGRVPVTLDGAIIALLALWVLGASSLFIATPDPVHNQPLKVWFDVSRIIGHPGLFVSYILQFSIIAALVFGYYWLIRRLLVRRALRERGWIAFLTGSLGLWLLYTPIACSIVLLLPLNTAEWALIPSEAPNPFLPENFRFSALLWVLACPIILASERLLDLAHAAMTRHEQVRAELQLLQQQINPHFLFNTLNTLYSMCLNDNAASACAVVKLSDLLRYSVYEAQDEWVSLDGEIDHLRNYLDLQLLRFGTHCRVDADWPDAAAQYRIPPQLLIMLVENAFKHGVERSDRPSTVTLRLAVEVGRLDFSCVNAPLSDEASPPVPGVGLANLRRRLELICGDDFLLESGPQGDGWTARLQLGLRPC